MNPLTRPEDFKALGTALGVLVAEKNAAYGNSAEKIGEIMMILYPEGVPKEKIPDALLLVRMLDKMNRIADGDPTYRGEDPWQDIGGYALIGQRMQRQRGAFVGVSDPVGPATAGRLYEEVPKIVESRLAGDKTSGEARRDLRHTLDTPQEIAERVANNKPNASMILPTFSTPEWVRWGGGKPENPTDGK